MATVLPRLIGDRIKRREDPRFVTGRGIEAGAPGKRKSAWANHSAWLFHIRNCAATSRTP